MSSIYNRARISVLIGFSLSGVLVGILSTRLAEIKINIHADAGSYGSAFATYALGGLVGYFFGARFVHRFGTRQVVHVFFYLIVLANFNYSIVPSVHLLAVNVFFGGFVASNYVICLNSQGVLIEQHIKRSFLPRAHAFWSLGAVTGALFSSLVAPYVSVRSTFLAVDLTCVVIWFFIKNGFLTSEYDDQPHLDPTQLPQKAKIPSRTQNFLILMAAGQSMSMIAESVAGDWSAVLLHEDLHIKIGPNGYAFATFSIVQLLTRYFAPRFIDRKGLDHVVRRVGVVGLSGYLIFLSIALRVNGTTNILIFSCIAFGFLSFGLGVMVPAYATAAGGIPRLPSARGLMVMGVSGAVILWIGRLIFSYVAQSISLPFAATAVTIVGLGAVYLAKYLNPEHVQSHAINPERQS